MNGNSAMNFTAGDTNGHQIRVSWFLRSCPYLTHVYDFQALSDSGPTVCPLEGARANRTPVLCPECKEKVGYRQQVLRRHILSAHLPCWICCPYPSCSWRGTRIEELKKHLIKDKCGPMPEQEQYQIYNTNLILGWILENDTPVQVAASYALGFVGERARELGKVELWSNLWGR